MKVREMLTPLAVTVSKNRKEKKRNNDTLTNVILKKTLLMVKTQIGCRLSSSNFPGEAKGALEREIKG